MKLEQLLEDPSFQNWAKRANEEDFAHWETWRAAHPEHASLMDEAKMMLVGLEFRPQKIPYAEKSAEWRALEQRLQLPQKEAQVRRIGRRRWISIAAAVVALLIAGWFVADYLSEPIWLNIQTGYGEIKTISLPDGSEVTLNAHSSLHYPASWSPGTARQVALEGEAFFEVKHGAADEAFTVNTGEIEVKVLGTRFNVLARRNAPTVSLVDGKVQLREVTSNANIILQPGETAQLDATSRQFLVTKGKIAQQTSWINRKWIFEKTPFSEVLQRIQDEFGLKYNISDSALLQRRASGEVSIRDRSTLFLALEVLLDIEIVERDSTLIIEKKMN